MKTLAILSVAAVLATATLPLFGGGRAQATIHPLVSSECAAQESQTGAGDTQDPPGQTPGATPGQGELAAVDALLGNGALILVDPGANFPDTAVWDGPAYNGDNGDDHCENPDANTHAD